MPGTKPPPTISTFFQVYGGVGGVGGLLAGDGDECTGDQGSGGGERREPGWCAGNERGGGHPRHSFVKAVRAPGGGAGIPEGPTLGDDRRDRIEALRTCRRARIV